MGRTKKYEKNLQKVQSMLDGDFNTKIVVGDHSIKSEEHREVGDTWTDSDGYEWVQHKGYREKKSVLPGKGIADNCSECGNYVIKKRDKEMFLSYKRCFECQVNFEARLRDWPLKFWAWIRLQQLNDMDSIEKDMFQWIVEKAKMKEEKLYDKSVANALANSNIDTTNVKLKQQT